MTLEGLLKCSTPNASAAGRGANISKNPLSVHATPAACRRLQAQATRTRQPRGRLEKPWPNASPPPSRGWPCNHRDRGGVGRQETSVFQPRLDFIIHTPERLSAPNILKKSLAPFHSPLQDPEVRPLKRLHAPYASPSTMRAAEQGSGVCAAGCATTSSGTNRGKSNTPSGDPFTLARK